MNKAQKLTIVLALAIIVVTGLYPPWIRTDAFGIARHRGYSFILHPPLSRADSLLVNAPVLYAVDWGHLAKAWLCVAALAVPLTVLLRTRGKKDSP